MCNPISGNDLGLADKNHVCACGAGGHGSHDAAATGAAGAAGAVIREHFLVNGMTCSHCVSSVTEELSAVDGVDSVSVELNAGGSSRVMVVSSRPVPEDDIRSAVAEAGYELVTA